MENYAKMLIVLNITNRTNVYSMSNGKVLLVNSRQKYFKSIKKILFIPCPELNFFGKEEDQKIFEQENFF